MNVCGIAVAHLLKRARLSQHGAEKGGIAKKGSSVEQFGRKAGELGANLSSFSAISRGLIR